MSPAQAAELRKASISFADYQAAFRRYQSCMAKIGYPVDVIGTENRVYNYQLPASLGSDARANHCYDYEFGQVDQRWQVQNQDTSQTADIYRTCLAKHNLSTTGSLRVLVARVKAAGLDVTTC